MSPTIDRVSDLDAQLAHAAATGQSLLILITEAGQGNDSIAIVQNAARGHSVKLLQIDLSISKNRAVAARFHPADAPLFLCLTPHGVINSRDTGTVISQLVRERISELEQSSGHIDATLAGLQATVSAKPQDAAARLALAEFFQNHHNEREAIPHLAAVAHSNTTEPMARVRAWVELVRAHLWVTEPEKARHEARDLIATLGPTIPEARSGGSLMLGLQDSAAKRVTLARQELETAISAAPNSKYAQEARAALARLPAKGGRT